MRPKVTLIDRRLRRVCMEIAREAHMLGRIYNARGEPAKPAEVERELNAYVDSVLDRELDKGLRAFKKGNA